MAMNAEEVRFNDILVEAGKAVQKAQAEMDLQMLSGYLIDEVSVLFATPEELEAFVQHCIGVGMEHFNTVRDTLLRVGNDGHFDVIFEFLRSPNSPWRIEAMVRTDMHGEAPLHTKHLEIKGSGCIIHASYKLESEHGYYQHIRELCDQGALRQASYRNSYGRFTYFGPGSDFYMKPRVNLRDQVQ